MQQHSRDMRRVDWLKQISDFWHTRYFEKCISATRVALTRVYFIVLTAPLILISFIYFVHCNFLGFSHWKKILYPERVTKVQPRWWGGTFSPRPETHRPQPQMIMNDLQNCSFFWGGGWNAKLVTDSDGWPRSKPLEYEIKAPCPDRRWDKLKIYIFAFTTTSSATTQRK